MILGGGMRVCGCRYDPSSLTRLAARDGFCPLEDAIDLAFAEQLDQGLGSPGSTGRSETLAVVTEVLRTTMRVKSQKKAAARRKGFGKAVRVQSTPRRVASISGVSGLVESPSLGGAFLAEKASNHLKLVEKALS
jgi:hypothetical protein